MTDNGPVPHGTILHVAGELELPPADDMITVEELAARSTYSRWELSAAMARHGWTPKTRVRPEDFSMLVSQALTERV